MARKPDLPNRTQYEAIQPDELLPLPVLRKRLGWGNRTISQAQKDGLRCLSYGKWKYAKGSDVIAFLDRSNVEHITEG